MATKKKRNKKYTGADAKDSNASVTKISVPQRSKAGKWWHENNKKVRSRIIFILVAAAFYLIISWLLRAIF